LAIGTAQQLVKQTGDLPVPIHLRNAPTKLMKDLGYGEKNTNTHMITLTILLNKNFFQMLQKHLFMFLEIIQRNTIREFFKTAGRDKYGY
jgi:putative ATPase